MSYTVRITQNKSKRESNEIKLKELQELRKELQKLKRENARLRKDLEKYSSFEPDTEIDSLAQKEIAQNGALSSLVCPDCRSTNLTTLNLGVKIIVVCKDCKWRKTK